MIETRDRAYIGGTAGEFIAAYAAARGVSVASLIRDGRVARYVAECEEYDFPHWEMGRSGPGWDTSLDPTNEMEVPSG